MPGILINRLSRPKANESPTETLANAHAILTQEMLPVIAPDAVEGRDYHYLSDIASRLDMHKEGEMLSVALTHVKSGNASWIAVTEISRLTGDGEALFQVANLCREHRVPIYTRERLYAPYQPWRAESYRELVMQFMMSVMEITTYMGRLERAREAAYPVDPSTGESRMKAFQGAGRHLNGAVPFGYVWNHLTSQPDPDQSIPCPDYLPPGETIVPAYTAWELARIVRDLGRTKGSDTAQIELLKRTGLELTRRHIISIWKNAFYAGRPTSNRERRGGKVQRRAAPVQTIGTYPAVDTWDEHLELQEAIQFRLTGFKANSSSWASGLIRCACGQPYTSSFTSAYCCRGYSYKLQLDSIERRKSQGIDNRRDRRKPIEGWEPTPTCGTIMRYKAHEAIEKHLRECFTLPDLARRLAEWQNAQRESRPDRQSLLRQKNELQRDLEKNEASRKRAVSLAIDGTITQSDLAEQTSRLQREQTGLTNRLKKLEETITAPSVAPTTIALLQDLLSTPFDEFWHTDLVTDPQRGAIARLFIDHIPLTGRHRSRAFGAPVWAEWLQQSPPDMPE